MEVYVTMYIHIDTPLAKFPENSLMKCIEMTDTLTNAVKPCISVSKT